MNRCKKNNTCFDALLPQQRCLFVDANILLQDFKMPPARLLADARLIRVLKCTHHNRSQQHDMTDLTQQQSQLVGSDNEAAVECCRVVGNVVSSQMVQQYQKARVKPH